MSGGVVAGFIAAWIFAGAIVVLVAGRFFTIANAQHHRSLSQEQASGDGQSDRLGGVSDGAEIDNFHSTLVASQE